MPADEPCQRLGQLARILLCLLMVLALPGLAASAEEPPAEVGAAFNFHGEVISVGVPGQGLVLALKDQNVAIHGLGPVWFWDAMGWPWPMVGDTILAKGRAVRYGGRTYHVAQTLTTGGQVMELRDKTNGMPHWHGRGLYLPLKEEQP